MPTSQGPFGTISSDGNTITIEIEPESLGDVSITTGGGQVHCFWDGTQWVCNSISFGQGAEAQA